MTPQVLSLLVVLEPSKMLLIVGETLSTLKFTYFLVSNLHSSASPVRGLWKMMCDPMMAMGRVQRATPLSCVLYLK